MNRKLLALLLTAAMLCTFILPQLVTPAVAGGWMDNYSYDETTHTLTVFGMDDPSNYLENEWFWQQLPWFSIRKEVEKVILSDTVTQIPNYAFREFTAITSIDIPNGVTRIGRSAFFDCAELTSVTIPESVTSIGTYAFEFCHQLTEIRVDSKNAVYCNDSSGALLGNGKSELLFFPKNYCGAYSIPDGVTRIATDIFSGCTGLTSITVPQSITALDDYMFSGCSALATVSLPGSLTSIGDYAFSDCASLAGITIPQGVTSVGASAFSNCTGLTSVSIPDSVTSIGWGAFDGCAELTSITIPDGVTSIDGYVFAGCSALTVIAIPNGVTSISYAAFQECTGLTSITIPDSVTSIGDNAFYGCTGLTSITIPDNVTSIGERAFWGCTGLTSITIPDSVTSIGDNAFGGCTGLTSIIVKADNPNYSSDASGVLFNKEKTELICCPNRKNGSYTIPDSVTSIDGFAFEGCARLASITIPDSVTSIGSFTFYGCTGLTSVTIPDGVTIIADATFCGCTGLTSITIPDSVTSIGDRAFLVCSGLTSITIPDSVTSIGDGAFYGCTGLTSITFSDAVASIGRYAFSNCTGLTSVTIPNSVTSISDFVFGGCTGLTSIIVEGDNLNYSSDVSGVLFNKEKTELICCPGGMVGSYTVSNSVTSIAEFAFSGCAGLTSIIVEGDNPNYSSDVSGVLFNKEKTELICCPGGKTGSYTIPDSVTSIGNCAFEGCTGLTSVCFLGDAPEIGYSVFQILDDESDAYINIPGLTLYYIEGKSGWTTPTWGEEEYPTAVWDGVNIPQPHTHSYTAVVTAPTCTEKGYTTYTCACGDSYKKDFVSALGHDFKDGTCTRCGASDPNYKPVDPTPEATFTDVSETAWYKNSVDYAVEHGLMNGTGTNTFEPESTMTRAMLVTVLWRYANAPKPGANPFTDVPNGKWYTDAVAWAAENGVVNGVGDGKFEPDGSVTREQMATILYRYAQKVGIDTSKHTELSAFPDASRVSAYARAPMQWIVAEGVIGGSRENGQDWLNPQGNATRAEVATILMRFIENVAKRPQ